MVQPTRDSGSSPAATAAKRRRLARLREADARAGDRGAGQSVGVSPRRFLFEEPLGAGSVRHRFQGSEPHCGGAEPQQSDGRQPLPVQSHGQLCGGHGPGQRRPAGRDDVLDAASRRQPEGGEPLGRAPDRRSEKGESRRVGAHEDGRRGRHEEPVDGADAGEYRLGEPEGRGSLGVRFLPRRFQLLGPLGRQPDRHQDERAGDERVLRVCQDPNNLPFSNRAGEGFENKIAELLARELGWTLEYTWFPQRMGFIRNTLRGRDPGSNRFKCDLVIGVPVGFELASTTKPYYRSTYALVYVKGKGLDSVTAPEGLLDLESAKLKSLKLGVIGQTPPADWLLRHRLFDQVVPYQLQSGDPERYPGEIVEKDLVAGKVDVAFVWGPIAGYFAKNAASAKLAVVPFEPTPGIQFDFRIAMGVRFGEREWKDRIERLVEANRARIQAILAAYGVPLLDDEGRIIKAQ